MNAYVKKFGKFGLMAALLITGMLLGGPLLTHAQGNTPVDPGSCTSTDYVLKTGAFANEFDGRNAAGYTRVTFDADYTCIVIQTVNATLAEADAMSATQTGIKKVDDTHYRVYGDGRALGGELSIRINRTVRNRKFSVVVPAAGGSGGGGAFDPSTCAVTGYHLGWVNHTAYGLADAKSGLYYAGNPGKRSGFEWVNDVAAGTNCVKLTTTNVAEGYAMYDTGETLHVWVSADGTQMVVYTLDGSDLLPNFMVAIEGKNGNLKGILGTVN